MAEKPSYQLLHVSSWIAHMAKHLLVGGQREVFLMLTETCLKAASLDWNLDNPVDQCCFLWVSGGAWQLEGLLVPARGTSQSVGTMGRGPQSPPFPFSLLSATPPSMTHLLTQPARENPCLQYSIFNDQIKSQKSITKCLNELTSSNDHFWNTHFTNKEIPTKSLTPSKRHTSESWVNLT